MKKQLLFLLFAFSSGQILSQPAAEPFEPELFEDMPYVRDLAVSRDGSEMYFSVGDYRHRIAAIVQVVRTDEGWSEPEVVPFSGKYRDIEPFLSGDGLRLYFASNRPTDYTSGEVKDYDIYYVERVSRDAPWGEPIRLPAPVNTEGDEFYPCVTAAGDLYFTAMRPDGPGKEDIWLAPADGQGFGEPQPVPGGLNTEGYEYNAFAAPDASYIIFSSYRPRDGRNRNDLYISFRESDGSYGEAALIPGIHSDAIDYCPFVDQRTNRLFFTSERSAVPASLDDTVDFNGFIEMIKTTPNGLGRIYSVDFGEVLRSLGVE